MIGSAILVSCVLIYAVARASGSTLTTSLPIKMWDTFWIGYMLVMAIVGLCCGKDFTRIPDSVWGLSQLTTFLGVWIAIYGFTCIVTMLIKDTICVVV